MWSRRASSDPRQDLTLDVRTSRGEAALFSLHTGIALPAAQLVGSQDWVCNACLLLTASQGFPESSRVHLHHQT